MSFARRLVQGATCLLPGLIGMASGIALTSAPRTTLATLAVLALYPALRALRRTDVSLRPLLPQHWHHVDIVVLAILVLSALNGFMTGIALRLFAPGATRLLLATSALGVAAWVIAYCSTQLRKRRRNALN